ncbi:MAG TPA: hypothetical protein VFT74_15185 [Isosphaeraceae bacterium]|nr:hypothetical protein [Isosphaeraceae bacterium]
MREILVVKVGGSLLDWAGLPAALDGLVRELQDREEDQPRLGPADEVSACECEPSTPALPHKGGGSPMGGGGQSEEMERGNGRSFSWGAPMRLVFVVGGGLAADFVRELDRVHRLGDEVSHGLALHALDLSAEALASLVPGLEVVETLEELPAVWDSGGCPVLAPRRVLEAEERARPREALEHSWDVTSDTISARLAQLIGASGLLLLKSVGVPEGTDLESASARGLVDSAFPGEAADLPGVWVRNLRDPRGGLTRLTLKRLESRPF